MTARGASGTSWRNTGVEVSVGTENGRRISSDATHFRGNPLVSGVVVTFRGVVW